MTGHSSVAGELRSNRRQAPGLSAQFPHLLIIGSVFVLALTGLPQRLDSFGPSEWLMDAAGGIETLRAVHHGAGAVLVVAGLYHLLSALFAAPANGRPGLLSMIPDGRDYLDAITTLLYFLGLRRDRPPLREPTYFQKLDYWVLAWGLMVMALTGLVRLFPARMTNLLSGDVVAAALQAHSDFALLVVAWVAVVHVAYAGLSSQPAAGAPRSEG
jgi:thiosulfate reductase cytochrome b subunit